MALARLNLSPENFYDLTPVEFSYALGEANNIEQRRERFELEKMRLQTLYYVNCHAKDPIRDVRQLMRFDWDKEEVFVPNDEDWEYLDNLFKNGIKNNH